MNRPYLTLVRHGQTVWSRDGLHTGRTDVPLTELGRRQAASLGEMLEDAHFSLVLSSPLSRARETMDIADHSKGAVVSADLVEWDYGVYEGRRTLDVRKEVPDWSVWTHPIHGGESVDAVGARADRVIDGLKETDGHVLVFGHGHSLRILAARWTACPPPAGEPWRSEPPPSPPWDGKGKARSSNTGTRPATSPPPTQSREHIPLDPTTPTDHRPRPTRLGKTGGGHRHRSTSIKAARVDTHEGRIAGPVHRIPTPQPATPEHVSEAIMQLVGDQPTAVVGVGFPGVVRHGVAAIAANLHPHWI